MSDKKLTDHDCCDECGMPIETFGEYHPYAACLMYKSCYSRPTVIDNLNAIINYAKCTTNEVIV